MLGAMSVDSGNPLAWNALFAPWVTAELPEAERKSLGTQKVPMMTSVIGVQCPPLPCLPIFLAFPEITINFLPFKIPCICPP